MRKYNTIMFDLDGTLIPFDQDEFIREYFGRLARKMIPMGFDKDILMKAIWAGINAMLNNDGAMTNKESFFEVFGMIIMEYLSKSSDERLSQFADDMDALEKVFNDFYTKEFDEVRCVLKSNPDRSDFIKTLRDKGYKLVLATNPLFPRVAVGVRLSWIGLGLTDFDYVTTYENSSYSKPNPGYYEEILHNINREASECIMIGNNPVDDMQAEKVGLDVYLVTDNLENQTGEDITIYNRGSFEDMEKMLYSF